MKQLKDIQCQNCGHPLQGDENFCPACGQKNDVRRLNIRNFFTTFINNFFNFDGKIWKTIITLIKHPARVTINYIQGKRISYSNPFKFLLQVSIVYFLWIGLLEYLPKNQDKYNVVKINQDLSIKDDKMNQKESDWLAQFDSINKATRFVSILQNDTTSGKVKDSIFQTLLAIAHDSIHGKFEHGKLISLSASKQKLFYKYLKNKGIEYKYFPKFNDSIAFASLGVFDKIGKLYSLVSLSPYNKMEEEDILSHLNIAPNIKNKMALRLAQKINLFFSDAKSRKMIKQSIISKITFALFFILPIVALFVRLFYYKTSYSYTEILVFVFYIQSVYFFVLSVEAIIEFIPIVRYFSSILEFWFVYYLYRSFYNFFNQRKLLTGFKLVFLIIPTYAISAGIGFLMITLLAFML